MGAVLAALLIVGGVGLNATVSPATDASAADGRDFNPGMIISDAVFYDSSTMTVAQIQSFLNARVPTCRVGYVCLKDYRQTTTSQPARSEGCAAYAGVANESAAQIISKVARACGINPRALIVLLEKEQGLVSDTWPSARQYRSATGYGCPDTAACDTAYYGFFNQVYQASWQFKKYRARPAGRAYQAGRTNTILWHPNAGCGSSQVYIQNQATAGLYLYTPYRPNAAALANLYGTGDACSSYGNRNFWRMFTDWFGSANAPVVDPRLAALFASTGGAGGILGPATDPPVNYADGGVGQEFQKGWAYWSSPTGAHRTAGSIGKSFIALGGPPGTLGYPLTDPRGEPRSGSSQAFQRGSLYWSPTTSIHLVSGRILNSYVALNGPSGVMGFPLDRIIGGPNNGIGQSFVGGWLWASPTTGIHRVSGAIARSYQALQGPAGTLGYPIAAQKAGSGDWVLQSFERGVLYHSPTGGTHFVLASMHSGYASLGGAGGALGAPVDSTRSYADGQGQRFRNGWLYWSAATGHDQTVGRLGASHWALGGAGGLLGYPAAAQRAEPGGGLSQQFTRGALYSSPTKGIHYVSGALNGEYQRLGGVGGTLGHPLDSTKTYAGGATQRFERGWLSWTASTGFVTTGGVIAASYTALGGPAGVLGHPVAARAPGAGGGYSQEFQNGWLIWSPASSIDRIARPIGEYYFANGASATLGYPKDSTRQLAGGVLEQEFTHVRLRWTSATGVVRY
ncbi:hypothetical protein GCM10009747_03560 [Agromyces humatus]|uniref:LGFP repeat-containing protein n=1 Tax=Agromyces humatus TaxID=279573 RepID=A0ABN2K7B5_9MICO